MARTYTWADAQNVLQFKLPRQITAGLDAHIANKALNRIWNHADWRETINILPPFFLIPQEQDYYTPTSAVPGNFLGLRQVDLVQTSANPEWRNPLTIVQDLALTGYEDIPQSISFEKSLVQQGTSGFGGFRLHPRPPQSLACCDWQVEGTYKMRPTKLQANALQSTLLPWDDLYFDVACAALEWAYTTTQPDTKAREAAVQNLVVLVNDMAFKEGFNIGEPQIHPQEPLVGGIGGFGNMWGGYY